MGITSSKAKQCWNKANYVQVKISVRPEIASAFKAKCITENVSMASKLSRFMDGQTGGSHAVKHPANPYQTRRQRRTALSYIIEQLDSIMESEKAYLDNIPENLRNSQRYEAAENSVSAIEEALEILGGAY